MSDNFGSIIALGIVFGLVVLCIVLIIFVRKCCFGFLDEESKNLYVISQTSPQLLSRSKVYSLKNDGILSRIIFFNKLAMIKNFYRKINVMRNFA